MLVIKDYLPSTDINLMVTLLKALEHLFESCVNTTGYNIAVEKFDSIGGMKVLEPLQLNPNVEIYKMVVNILKKYTACEETTIDIIKNEASSMEITNNL